MKIESHQNEPKKMKISTKNVAWYWRVPYVSRFVYDLVYPYCSGTPCNTLVAVEHKII